MRWSQGTAGRACLFGITLEYLHPVRNRRPWRLRRRVLDEPKRKVEGIVETIRRDGDHLPVGRDLAKRGSTTPAELPFVFEWRFRRKNYQLIGTRFDRNIRRRSHHERSPTELSTSGAIAVGQERRLLGERESDCSTTAAPSNQVSSPSIRLGFVVKDGVRITVWYGSHALPHNVPAVQLRPTALTPQRWGTAPVSRTVPRIDWIGLLGAAATAGHAAGLSPRTIV